MTNRTSSIVRSILIDGSSCRRFFADDDSPCFLGVAGSESELEDDVDDDESDRIVFSFYAFPPRLRYFFSNFLTLRFQAVVKSPPMISEASANRQAAGIHQPSCSAS